MHNINKRLIQIREEFGKTQVEMSKSFGVFKQTYGTIEKGTRQIHIREIKILKDDFNINPSWLLFNEGTRDYISSEKQKELIDLILDFRAYGGEVDLVKREIVKKILSKFYAKKDWLFFFKRGHKNENRVHYAFIRVLSTLKYDGLEDNAKNYIRDKIEEFNDNSPFLSDVKKELYSLLENISNKDCYYLLDDTEFTRQEIKNRITSIDIKMNNFFSKNKI